LAEKSKATWIIAIVIIAALIFCIGYFVTQYIDKPDDMEGLWNGTISYQNIYYESRFVFYNNSSCEMWLFPKPNFTFNYTQIRTGALYHETMTWQKNGDYYDLIYPDYKVRLDYPGIPHTLRFNETAADGYKVMFMGYLSKNYHDIQDFGALYDGDV
jgi:hypothetical protein